MSEFVIRNEPEYKKLVSEVEARAIAEHERIRKWLEENGNALYF